MFILLACVRLKFTVATNCLMPILIDYTESTVNQFIQLYLIAKNGEVDNPKLEYRKDQFRTARSTMTRDQCRRAIAYFCAEIASMVEAYQHPGRI